MPRSVRSNLACSTTWWTGEDYAVGNSGAPALLRLHYRLSKGFQLNLRKLFGDPFRIAPQIQNSPNLYVIADNRVVNRVGETLAKQAVIAEQHPVDSRIQDQRIDL